MKCIFLYFISKLFSEGIIPLKKVIVTVGSSDLDRVKGDKYHVDYLTYHKNFDQKHQGNIGLFHLVRPIRFSKNIQPISLPEGNFSTDVNKATLTGWNLVTVNDFNFLKLN